MKAKLKISEDLCLQYLEEKSVLDLKIADIDDAYGVVVAAHEMKMEAMRLKLKKIRKYAISREAWYHYAVGSIVVLDLNSLKSCMLVSIDVCFVRTMYYIWALLYFDFNVMNLYKLIWSRISMHYLAGVMVFDIFM